MPALAPLYPDVVAVTGGYLRTALGNVPVSSRIPSTRPAKFVVLTRTGGPESRPFDAAQITVDCWAPANDAAMDLAQLARRLLHDMAGTVQADTWVHQVLEFGGPSDLPDPVSGTPRVSFTMQIQMRGHAA